jgi:hypothetical protein
MTRNAKIPVGVASSAPDTPSAGQPGRPAAVPPGGPAPAIVAALVAAPGATAAHLARAAGIARPAATQELAALEKTGHATWYRSMSRPPGQPGTSPRGARTRQPRLPRSAARLRGRRGGRGYPGRGSTRHREPGPEQEDARPATPASPTGIAPDAGEALGAAVAATQTEAALQAGDLAGALAAADHLTQAAVRARRLLRHADHASRRGPAAGTPPGELCSLVAAHLAAYPGRGLRPPRDRPGPEPVIRGGSQRTGPADRPRPGPAHQRGAPPLASRRAAGHRQLTRAPGCALPACVADLTPTRQGPLDDLRRGEIVPPAGPAA